MPNTKLALSTLIGDEKVFVSSTVRYTSTGKRIPMYTTDPCEAANFLGPAGINHFLETVANYTARHFKQELLQVYDDECNQSRPIIN